MRDIEGLEEAITQLDTHWPQILAHFNEENRKYKTLFKTDHDKIGRVLKCHLLVESYLDKYISHEKKIDNLNSLRLSFHQKAQLIPTSGVAASVVRPGILELNKIRNKFGHKLSAVIRPADMAAIDHLLEVARPEMADQDLVTKIEAFTTVACTWLLVAPSELAEVYEKAFRKVVVKKD